MIFGFVAALLAAGCYGVGSVWQAIGAQRASASTGVDPRLLLRLSAQLSYVGGLALDAVGFVATLFALRSLPLFLVQSAVAGSIGVTAVLAARTIGARLTRSDLVALGLLAAGLVLLAIGAKPGPASHVPSAAGWLLLAGVVIVGVAGVLAGRAQGPRGAVTLAASAGFAFAGVGIAARTLVIPHPRWHVFGQPALYAVAAYGVLALLLFATALQRGTVTQATAVVFAVETVVPSAIGLAFLGDATRPGAGLVAAIAGFIFTLAGTLRLARHSTAG